MSKGDRLARPCPIGDGRWQWQHAAGCSWRQSDAKGESRLEVAEQVEEGSGSVVAIPIELWCAKEGELEACPHGEHGGTKLGKNGLELERRGEEGK